MKMDLISNAKDSELGKLAQGGDAQEASAAFGAEVMDVIHQGVGHIIEVFLTFDYTK